MDLHNKFFHLTGQSLDKYIDKYGFNIGLFDKDEQSLCEFEEQFPEEFNKAREQLLLAASKERDVLKWENHYSSKRSRQSIIASNDYAKILKEFISEPEYIDGILNNNISAITFNPSAFLDNNLSNYRSIIIPTRDYTERNKRIYPRFVGETKVIRDYRIDKEEISKANEIVLTREDIAGIDFRILHPIIYKRLLFGVY